jgi:hypothetical protein
MNETENICDEILKHLLENTHLYYSDTSKERTKAIKYMMPKYVKQSQQIPAYELTDVGFDFARSGGFIEERKIKLRKKYIAQLNDIDYKNHKLICDDIGVEGNIESFLFEVEKYSAIEYKNTKDFGTPDYIVKLKKQIPMNDNSQHQTFNNSPVGTAILAKESTIYKEPPKDNKLKEDKLWHKPLWVGIILLLLSGLGWVAQIIYQRYSTEHRIEQIPTVQGQKK